MTLRPATHLLNRVRTPFAGSDADAIIHWQHKNLPIADLSFIAGASSRHNRLNGRLDKIFVDGDLQLHFAQEIDRRFLAAINAELTFLPTETLTIHHRESKDFDFGESIFYSFETIRLNNGDDELHGEPPW
jgi:hypothetical protein